MTLRLRPLPLLVVVQRLPEPVRRYWPVFSLSTNVGTRQGHLPACWYVDASALGWLLTLVSDPR